jgi:tetratricopeptide (TPR) repeat protein
VSVSHIVNLILSAIGVVAIVWTFWHAFRRSSDRAWLICKWIISAGLIWFMFHGIIPEFYEGGSGAMVGLFLIAIWTLTMTMLWRHAVVDLISAPFTSLYDGGTKEVEPKPFYSVAMAQRKKAKPQEAIAAIHQQLAKFPRDYEGILLMATIQAEDMNDLSAAEETLNQFCDWEKAPPSQVAAALTQLADWQIKILRHVASARATLERIIKKFPDSEFAKAAAQRIAHLGGTQQILFSAQNRQPVAVPVGERNAGLRDSIAHIVPPDADPEEVAAELAKHLQTYPLDIEAREKLAVIYARHYQRLDLAKNELQQLVQLRGQSPKLVAHWLNLLADLQIRAGADYETVAPTLQQIIESFPGLPFADLAQSRLNHLKLEIKGQREAPGNKMLGEYEQNIGIKYGKAYGEKS